MGTVFSKRGGLQLTMFYSIKMRSAQQQAVGQRHISGAERIVNKDKVDKTTLSMIQRAFAHERGRADFINIKIEAVAPEQIAWVSQLPVYTLAAKDRQQAETVALAMLERAGICQAAVKKGWAALKALTDSMHGAMILSAATGERLDEFGTRGVRVSSMDVADADGYETSLAGHGLTDIHVREAVVLASKVQAAPGVLAELCWSDDPSYTTGYVADRTGYYRVPNIKKAGAAIGGRAFFVSPQTDISDLVSYLQSQPVFVRQQLPAEESPCKK